MTNNNKERQAAIEASREHRTNPERFRVIFESTHMGIVTTDINGSFLDANPAFCSLVGYSLEEILQLNIAELTHPEDLPENLNTRAKVINSYENSEILEKRYVHKDGHLVWARLVGSKMTDAQGNVIGLFAMVEDITARKEGEIKMSAMQQEVMRSEQRLRYITRASLDLIWDWDLETNELWWGDGLENLFGFNPAMMGHNVKFWLKQAHPEDRVEMLKAFEDVISGATDGWHMTFRIKKLNGEYTPVEERAFAIRDTNGKVQRIVSGISDISARLDLEEKLRQSQRLDSLGQLTGGVAHDFNNLLTVMLGNAELLSAQLDSNPNLQELAETIIRSALQGADLTHRLLAFARRQALEPRNINLNHLVDNMGKILIRTLGEEISFSLCPAQDLWLCEVDPNQLEASILNLCLNARDAMPEGGELLIETSNMTLKSGYTDQHFDLQPGDYVCLAISDTGTGIPPENLERILEPFFTTKPKGKGTGLGLSTIFGFIKQSLGHLSVYSEIDHGTTVRIYLPKTSNEAEEHFEPTRSGTAVSTGAETILLVEDDELVRQYAEMQLNSLGYRVYSAANGQEALDLLDAHSDIDLLFTDVVMPGGMGGRQLAEIACQRQPDLKVLYSSGYTENSIVHNGRLDPGVYLLGKPYQRHELAGKLREVLDSQL